MNERTAFVTMDMDWAPAGVLADTQALVNELDIPVTFFVTNDSPMLAEFRTDSHFTLGIHPNLTAQLNGKSNRSFREVLCEMLELVPEAVDLRCHALVDATPLLICANELGLKRDHNLFLPYSSGISLKPFRHFGGITRVPYFYEDDAWCFEPTPASPEEHLSQSSGLRIFNFHPIHLFLNTESMTRYERAKSHYQDPDGLRPFINPDPANGARAFLKRLAHFAAENGFRFGRMESL